LARHVIAVIALWVLFSAAGLAVILTFTPFPVAAAEEARLIDEAFTLLTILAVPVFSFVMATLVYSIFRFRIKGEPTEDGPPVRYKAPIIIAWFVLTTALTIFVIIHPGITGINAIRAQDKEEPDLVVQIEGGRWYWRATYPEQRVFSRRELVLPVDESVRFYVTATDVLHSFWVPAFRVKIDAVPGMVTKVSARPNQLGNFELDPNFRLQCAELCGAGHAKMLLPVRVVERSEFDAWIAQQQPVR
jgi:cytochrome c oxidase subunit 2